MASFFKNSKLFKDTLIYSASNALFTGLPLLLMPFLVSVLSPEDYGIIDLYRSLTMVFIAILGLSTVQAIARFYYDLDENDFRKFTSSIIGFHFLVSSIVLLILTIISFFIHSYIISLLFMCVLYFLFNQVSETLLTIFRIKGKPIKFLYLRLTMVIFDLLLLFVLHFVFFKFDWTYRVIPNITTAILLGLASLFILKKQYGITIMLHKKLLVDALVFSSPLVIHMLGGYILNIGDRFFITHYLGEAKLGAYSVAYQIGMVVSFFYTSFNLAWTPIFFELMNKKQSDKIRRVKNMVYIGIPILGVLSVCGWLFLSTFITNLEKYNVKLELVIVITIAYIFLSFYKFNSNYFFYAKKTKTLAIITATTSVVCIVAYVFTIPIMGLMGAAWSTLFTFILMFVFTLIFKPNEETT